MRNRRDEAAAVWHKIKVPFADSHESGPRLGEDSHLGKPLAGFHAKQPFSNSTGDLTGTVIARPRRKITRCFKREALVDVKSKSTARPKFNLLTVNSESSKVGAGFVFRKVG